MIKSKGEPLSRSQMLAWINRTLSVDDVGCRLIKRGWRT